MPKLKHYGRERNILNIFSRRIATLEKHLIGLLSPSLLSLE